MFINDKQSTGRISRVVEITPLSPNLMLNSEKKKNILTLVLSEKKFLNETKNHNPSPQVKWSIPKEMRGWDGKREK